MLEWLIQNKDGLVVFIQLAGLPLTIFGWIVVFGLGLRQQRKQIIRNARMKVYEELYLLKKEIDAQSENLGILLTQYSLPFLEMSWKKDPINGKLQALGLWQDYIKKLDEATRKFVRAYLKLWSHSDMWIAAMPTIKKAKDALFVVQLKILTDELYGHRQYLQDQSVKEFDWTRWDRNEIEQRTEALGKCYDLIAVAYVDDYLALIHNRLVAPILGRKKRLRENFSNANSQGRHVVLTEIGIKEVQL